MSEYKARISWKRTTADFVYETYDRTHSITFGGGISVKASSAPEFSGKAEYANPEEAFAAAISSCHMLTFLAIAAKAKYVVDTYQDEAVAILAKNTAGQLAITQVHLHPKITFSGGNLPSPEKISAMHEKSHQHCFIANSVKCEVVIQSQS